MSLEYCHRNIYLASNDMLNQQHGVFEVEGQSSRQKRRKQKTTAFDVLLMRSHARNKRERTSQQAPADRMVGVGLLASLIAGVISGIGARMVMRIVAVTAHIPLQFTAATINIVFLGLMFGLIA